MPAEWSIAANPRSNRLPIASKADVKVRLSVEFARDISA
jgi:hypothetical protein